MKLKTVSGFEGTKHPTFISTKQLVKSVHKK